ncbi:MAG: BBP7 family outer membrane beta-barrel protein, partial [Chthoniobacteraceae bacterium]
GGDLTLGSGSVDARIGTSVYYRHGRGFLSGTAQYAIATEGAYGYRFANDLTWDSGVGYDLLSKPDYKLSLEAAFSGEHKGSDTYKDQPVDSTGFTVMYLGPKLSYTWKDRLSAHFGVDFPVSITNSGLQAVPGARVRAGFTWLFGPGSSEAAGAQAKPRSVGMDGSAPPIWLPAPDTHFYGGVEYLLWWVKDAPLSVPLVSTGGIAATHHGLLGTPAVNGAASTVLYGASHSPAQGGNDNQRFQGFSGMRLKLGYSLGDEHRFGIEASGFMLNRETAGYEASGDSSGNPVLGIPVYNSIPYTIGTMTIRSGEDSLPFSLPLDPARFRANGIVTGNAKVVNDLELWGAELTGVISLYRRPSWELSGLVGVRYLDLTESLNLTTTIQGVSGPYTGQYGVATDRFRTQNRFFGGLLGLRGTYSSGRLSADLAARVALGSSNQEQVIAGGFYARNFTGPYSSGTEGVFAQPANEGRTSNNRFSVVPDVQLKIGYAITPRLRATLGYDFMYWSSVQRPGDQINREIPKGQTFNQADPAVSTTSPSRLTKTTDFFAHGFSFGMDFRF